jgi:hypothetical protein
MADLTIAKTILEQLGGNRFVVMTGARNISGSEKDKSLSFKLPMKTKNQCNYVRITLTPSDLYSVEFLSIRGTSFKVKGTVDDVYCDQLLSTFETATGIYGRL